MSRDLQQPPDLDLGVPQQPSSIYDEEGRAHQLVSERASSSEVIEREIGGDVAGDALRAAFGRLLNKRGVAARHE